MLRPNSPPQGNNRLVYLAALFASFGGLIFGYDMGTISGALIFITKNFELAPITQGLVVSLGLVGAAVGAMTAGRIADKLGRKKILLASSLIFILGACVDALAPSVGILLMGRLLIGLGVGFASAAAPLYIAEIAPSTCRGTLLSLFQLAMTLGILFGYIIDYSLVEKEEWRLMLGSSVIPGMILGLGMLFFPETPRWLAKKNKIERASQALVLLRGTHDIGAELTEIQSSSSQREEKSTFSQLWTPSVRSALMVGIGLAVFQQITGINTVIYYAPLIIQSAGLSSHSSAILATVGIGLVNVVMTLIAMWLVDRLGRRPLLLTGMAGMAISLGILGYIFHLQQRDEALAQVAVITLMAYVAAFAISIGPIFWLLIGEIYPLKIRGLAEGLTVACNWFFNFLVSLTFVPLLNSLGASLTFWLYGLFALAALVFSYFRVPETKGRSLEEIESFWRRSTPNE